MGRIQKLLAISIALCCAVLAGCRGNAFVGSQTPSSGNSSVVLAMTDTPPSMVTILSAPVTLTGASLTPGNVSLFSGSTTVDLSRLQTDVAYLTTATSIPAGNYTGLTLTFANPKLTIENDTGAAIVSGSTTCAIGAICTIAPTTVANLSTTVPLSGFSIAANSTTGFLIDVSLDSLLSAALGADFSAGTTVTTFSPGGVGAPPVGAEDVVGQVGTVTASSNTFTLTNATGSYSLKVDNTSTFFPSSVCTTAGFSCLKSGQILSVDIGIQPDGSILARNILFEDSDSSDAEVEGIITRTNVGSQEFDIVIQSLSASVSGLSIDQPITVQYSTSSPVTPFDIDFLHVDNTQASTSGFLFAAPADLAVGQQVSIRRNSASTNSLLKADRVRLRSSRVTATVQSVGAPNINLFDLPSLFSGHGSITQITAQTFSFPQTIYFEIGKTILFTNIAPSNVVSVRGPLFIVTSGRTLLATKVVVKP